MAAALLAASAPVDASAIAAGFRQGRCAELKVAAILAAMARTGAAATRDGDARSSRAAWLKGGNALRARCAGDAAVLGRVKGRCALRSACAPLRP